MNNFLLVGAVNELTVSSSALLPLVSKMDALAQKCHIQVDQFGLQSYHDIFWLFLKGTLYSQLPERSVYRQPIQDFYERAFHVFHVRRDNGTSGEEGNSSMDQDDEDNEENVNCEGNSVMIG